MFLKENLPIRDRNYASRNISRNVACLWCFNNRQRGKRDPPPYTEIVQMRRSGTSFSILQARPVIIRRMYLCSSLPGEARCAQQNTSLGISPTTRRWRDRRKITKRPPDSATASSFCLRSYRGAAYIWLMPRGQRGQRPASRGNRSRQQHRDRKARRTATAQDRKLTTPPIEAVASKRPGILSGGGCPHHAFRRSWMLSLSDRHVDASKRLHASLYVKILSDWRDRVGICNSRQPLGLRGRRREMSPALTTANWVMASIALIPVREAFSFYRSPGILPPFPAFPLAFPQRVSCGRSFYHQSVLQRILLDTSLP